MSIIMKFVTALYLLSHSVFHASAHSTVAHLIVNGTVTSEWKYMLDVADWYPGVRLTPDDQGYKIFPQMPEDLNSTNITCGRNAFDSLGKTEIADIVAGDEIGFRNLQFANQSSDSSLGIWVHPDPAQIWLSRAPNDDLSDYRGTGDWFKVGFIGPENNTAWKMYRKKEARFTLPATIPPGAYLLRFEMFWPSTATYHQWYINCALVRIHNRPGTVPGTPTGFLKFPAEGGGWPYAKNDPGLDLPFNQYKLPPEQMRLLEYQPPGPPVWTG